VRDHLATIMQQMFLNQYNRQYAFGLFHTICPHPPSSMPLQTPSCIPAALRCSMLFPSTSEGIQGHSYCWDILGQAMYIGANLVLNPGYP